MVRVNGAAPIFYYRIVMGVVTGAGFVASRLRSFGTGRFQAIFSNARGAGFMSISATSFAGRGRLNRYP